MSGRKRARDKDLTAISAPAPVRQRRANSRTGVLGGEGGIPAGPARIDDMSRSPPPQESSAAAPAARPDSGTSADREPGLDNSTLLFSPAPAKAPAHRNVLPTPVETDLAVASDPAYTPSSIPRREIHDGPTHPSFETEQEHGAVRQAKKSVARAKRSLHEAESSRDFAGKQREASQSKYEGDLRVYQACQQSYIDALKILSKAKKGGDAAEVEEAEAEVDKAEAKVDKAKAEMDKAEAKVDKAEAKVDKAKAEVDKAEAKVDKAKAEVDKAKAEVDKAELQLAQAQAIEADEKAGRLLQCQEGSVEEKPKTSYLNATSVVPNPSGLTKDDEAFKSNYLQGSMIENAGKDAAFAEAVLGMKEHIKTETTDTKQQCVKRTIERLISRVTSGSISAVGVTSNHSLSFNNESIHNCLFGVIFKDSQSLGDNSIVNDNLVPVLQKASNFVHQHEHDLKVPFEVSKSRGDFKSRSVSGRSRGGKSDGTPHRSRTRSYNGVDESECDFRSSQRSVADDSAPVMRILTLQKYPTYTGNPVDFCVGLYVDGAFLPFSMIELGILDKEAQVYGYAVNLLRQLFGMPPGITLLAYFGDFPSQVGSFPIKSTMVGIRFECNDTSKKYRPVMYKLGEYNAENAMEYVRNLFAFHAVAVKHVKNTCRWLKDCFPYQVPGHDVIISRVDNKVYKTYTKRFPPDGIWNEVSPGVLLDELCEEKDSCQVRVFKYIEDVEDDNGNNSNSNQKGGLTVESFRALYEAVVDMHQKGYIHGDIRRQNVRFKTCNEPVIIDFEMSSLKDEEKKYSDSLNLDVAGLRKRPEGAKAGAVMETKHDLLSVVEVMRAYEPVSSENKNKWEALCNAIEDHINIPEEDIEKIWNQAYYAWHNYGAKRTRAHLPRNASNTRCDVPDCTLQRVAEYFEEYHSAVS